MELRISNDFFSRDAFDSPARPEAWSPPPYDPDVVPSYPVNAHAYLSHHHRVVRRPSLSPPPLRAQEHLHLSPRRPPTAHYSQSHQVSSSINYLQLNSTFSPRCPPRRSCPATQSLLTSWTNNRGSLSTWRCNHLSITISQGPLSPLLRCYIITNKQRGRSDL